MADVVLKLSLDDVIQLIDQLSPDQKRLLRQRLDEDWSARFGQALDTIQSGVPTDIPEDEVNADIEQAIREVRSNQR